MNKSYQKLPKITNTCPKLPTVAQGYQKLPIVTNSCSKFAKTKRLRTKYHPKFQDKMFFRTKGLRTKCHPTMCTFCDILAVSVGLYKKLKKTDPTILDAGCCAMSPKAGRAAMEASVILCKRKAIVGKGDFGNLEVEMILATWSC